jgi:hypothetical protein
VGRPLKRVVSPVPDALHDRRILVVDDEQYVLSGTKKQLCAAGFV